MLLIMFKQNFQLDHLQNRPSAKKLSHTCMKQFHKFLMSMYNLLISHEDFVHRRLYKESHTLVIGTWLPFSKKSGPLPPPREYLKKASS